MIAKITHKPDIRPMSTHVKILQRVSASSSDELEVVELEAEKKSFSQFVTAVLCLAADMMIQVAATANPAIVSMM